MTDKKNNNYVSHENLKKKYVKRFFMRGVRKITGNVKSLMCFLVFFLFLAVTTVLIRVDGSFGLMLTDLYRTMYVMVMLMVGMSVIILMGIPKGYFSIMRQLERISGMSNADNEYPVLLDRDFLENKKERWVFESIGVPLERFMENVSELENALDIAVDSIEQGCDGHQIVMYLISHPGDWPSKVQWDNTFSSENPSEVVLGVCRTDRVIHDFSRIPHLFISGQTGCGKTVLLKMIILQSLLHGYDVYLVDFKRLLDYQSFLPYCQAVTTDADFLNVLVQLEAEHLRRTNILIQNTCTNIDDYNCKNSLQMQRKMLIVDELTEALSRDKANKNVVDAIEEKLCSLCRLCRATGIQVVVATQRGSADRIQGDIRTNTYKILGRCDDNLSILTMGTADAARRIPKKAIGRFVCQDNTMFQSYYCDFGEKFFEGILQEREIDLDDLEWDF